MSELPFEIPTNLEELRKLFFETRSMFASMWEGLPEEAILRRPGPIPEWSVKDIIVHICFWESFAISRITILAAGLKLHLISDFDTLNQQAFEQFRDLPLTDALDMFKANEAQIAALIDSLSFEEWVDEERENFRGQSLLRMLGGNTFGHYYDHIDDLRAYREKNQ